MEKASPEHFEEPSKPSELNLTDFLMTRKHEDGDQKFGPGRKLADYSGPKPVLADIKIIAATSESQNAKQQVPLDKLVKEGEEQEGNESEQVLNASRAGSSENQAESSY
jgi:hypothetical protein